jgi:hypothetical protein
MKTTIKHNTSTVAVLDKWLVVENQVILATFSSRQSARDSKLGKVLSTSSVEIVIIEKKISTTVDAHDLIQRLYGKMKSRDIFKEARKQGIAYLTIWSAYNNHLQKTKFVGNCRLT